jgi:hypothetical protein
LQAIWDNQNPPDCSQANYIIAHPATTGFGSVMHVEADALALALKLNRVLIRSDGIHPIHDWQTNTPHCKKQGVRSLECYYLPWSKCTLADAMAVAAADKGSNNMHDIRTFHQGKSSHVIACPRVRGAVYILIGPILLGFVCLFRCAVITRDGQLASYEDSLKEVLERTEGHRVTALHVGMLDHSPGTLCFAITIHTPDRVGLIVCMLPMR